MSEIKQLRNLIAPTAPVWGVVLEVATNTLIIGVGGTTRQFPRQQFELKKGDRVIIEGDQLRIAATIKMVAHQV